MAMNPNFYLVYDTETLGLNPQIHQIAEFAGVLLDAASLNEVSYFQSYFYPTPPVYYEDTALKITGLSIDKLYEEGKPALQVWKSMIQWLESYADDTYYIQTVGMNKVFDAPRVESQLIRYGLKQPWNLGHKWDIMDMARAYSLDTPKYNLSTLCNYFGIPDSGAHGALADARMTAEVFRRMEAIRNKIAEVLQLEPMQKYLNNCRALA